MLQREIKFSDGFTFIRLTENDARELWGVLDIYALNIKAETERLISAREELDARLAAGDVIACERASILSMIEMLEILVY